jgi:hypothetical protein
MRMRGQGEIIFGREEACKWLEFFGLSHDEPTRGLI